MPMLAELQNAMRDVSLGGDAAVLAPAIIGDGFAAEQRLNIHRNNTTILLSDALAATYSVVYKLVGEDFFNAVARLFVRAQPPRSPCLFEYGMGFADFLATLPAAQGLPYLADIARLEWCWNEAFHALDVAPLTSVDLADVAPQSYGDLVFTPNPSLRLLASPFPIKEIWDVNQCGANPDASVNLDEGPQSLAVLRPRGSVEMIELSPGGFIFTEQLARGASLEQAFVTASNAEAQFDPSSTLTVLITAGAFHTFALKA